jgi:hypothetical protein
MKIKGPFEGVSKMGLKRGIKGRYVLKGVLRNIRLKREV